MKTKMKCSTIPLDEVRLKYLREPKCAHFTIKLAVQEFDKDGDLDPLLDTLRLVAQAQGGLAALARKTDMSRLALHDALSPRGNPRLRTFQSVLASLGLRMTFKPVRAPAITNR